MAVERKHREEAINMWTNGDWTKVGQLGRDWVETGLENEQYPDDAGLLSSIAAALAERDARIAETEEHLARKSEAMAALLAGMRRDLSNAWIEGVNAAIEGIPGGDEYASSINKHVNDLQNPYVRKS